MDPTVGTAREGVEDLGECKIVQPVPNCGTGTGEGDDN